MAPHGASIKRPARIGRDCRDPARIKSLTPTHAREPYAGGTMPAQHFSLGAAQ